MGQELQHVTNNNSWREQQRQEEKRSKRKQQQQQQQQQEKILQQQQKKLRGNNNKNINNEQPHQHNYPPLTTDVERAKYLLEASAGNVDLALALYWDDYVAHHVQAQQQGQNQGGNQGGSIDKDLNIKKDNRIMKVKEMKRKKKEEKVDFIKTRNDVYENDND